MDQLHPSVESPTATAHRPWHSVQVGLVAAAMALAQLAVAQEPPATADGAPKAEAAPADPAKLPTEPAKAAEKEAAPPSLLDQLDDGTLPPVPPTAPTASPFQMEWHGYFRFRPDMISNGHLGMAVPKEGSTGFVTTSSVLPPLSLWPANNDPTINPQSDKVGKSNGETALSGASMRLRLQPTITIEKDVKINLTLDILDNYVLGSDPDYAGALSRPDVPLVGFTMGARPGSIAVKEAYGEWKMLLGVLRVGRQASHWGLGMLAHGGGGDSWDLNRPTLWYGAPRRSWEGHGYDVDGGNFNDRAAFITKIPKLGWYVSLFYDYLANGISDADPARIDVQSRNLTTQDDVRQYGLVLMKRPLSDDDAAERQRVLEDERRPVFDWGLYSVIRTQASDLIESKKPSSQMNLTDAGSAKLIHRGAKAFIGDAWGRYEQRLSPLRRVIVEGEVATILGSVDDVSTNLNEAVKARDIKMFGGSFKAAYQDEGMGYTLDLGYASGDNTRCFGVFGKGDCAIATQDNKPNETIDGFRFNRSYNIDFLLFRELIGTVTNAMYIKPTVSINAYPWYGSDLLGLDLSVMQAFAARADGTPGNGSNIGTEMSARALIGRRGQAYLDVVFAYALTGSAFNLEKGWNSASEAKEPENAWRLVSHMALMF